LAIAGLFIGLAHDCKE